MASFTDAISQFNPYVSQLPIDAMVKVGTYKQQKYDEGVQRIQGEIDKVAGLDITKPIHKQYLQSKLNELGSKLKTVAAGDFSNVQLVNSVGGMASQIGKDPTIQNAVRSTQHARKEQENIQIAQKAGKSSVDNEDFYYDKYNKWLNDGKLETVFTDEYIEYKDVDAKLRDLTSKLKEDELGIQNPYMRDEQGQTLYFYRDPVTKREVASTDPSKGEKRLDLDMIDIKVKGLPAQRILNNFYNSLDSNDIRQMKINSWAHYRGAGPEYFKSDIVAAYDNKKEMLSQEKIDLAVKLQNPQITGVAKLKLESRLNEVNTMIDDRTLEKEMNDDLAELQNPRNLEEFKYKLYTQTHLTNLAKDLSYRSYVQERKANPAEQADLARKKFQAERIDAANEMYRWKITEKRLQDKDDYERLKDIQNKLKKGYRVSPGNWGTGVEAPTVNDLNNDMLSSAQQFAEEQTRIAQAIFSGDKDKNMTLDEKIRSLSTMASNYRKNPYTTLTPDQKKYLQQYTDLEDGITKSINAYNSGVKFETDTRNKIVSDRIGNQTISVGGKTYSANDAIEFNSTLKQFEPDVVDVSTYSDPRISENFYKNYKGGKLLRMWQAYQKDKNTFSWMNDDDEKLVSFIEKTKSVASKINTDVANATSDYIARISPKYTVQVARIDIKNEDQAASLDDFLALKDYQFQQKGALDVRNPGDYNPTTAAEIRSKPGSTFQIEKRKDGNVNIIMSSVDGKRVIIPGIAQETARLFPEVAVSSPFNDIDETIRTSDGFTTNSANQRFVPGSGATAVNATINGYSSKYLPQLKGTGYESKVRFDVEGFKQNTGDPETDLFTLVMYVPDPKTGQWKGDYVTGSDGGEYISQSGIVDIFSKISPYNINQAIKTFK